MSRTPHRFKVGDWVRYVYSREVVKVLYCHIGTATGLNIYKVIYNDGTINGYCYEDEVEALSDIEILSLSLSLEGIDHE